jgi:DNA-binding CsgD family transcriptional regulator
MGIDRSSLVRLSRWFGGVSTPALSHKEKEILALLAQGLTDQDIAAALFLSVRRIQKRLDRIAAKLGLGDLCPPFLDDGNSGTPSPAHDAVFKPRS